MNRPVSFLIFGIIFLGAIGLLGNLLSDPAGFIKNAVILALTIGIVIFAVKRLTRSKPNAKHERSFMKAARDSKKRVKTRDAAKGKADNVQSFSLAKNLKKARNKSRSDIHLTVIEGKKGKKKNRALF
ncbi:putative membrane protein YhiD involved in acid resistance [Peribacillus deserti]|uniref:Membrane protein YhiD involved in acid resistance n=1 Tax=Peribacillus deserti TaxID=673318 RepID=A0ABS2QJU1_9BACI|nr:SA1362 family protein [Peribacillus deserti]MBM7693270.1 putative membrane protein YhiD involved in acid resistance [Peribacillus deserti]